MFNFMSLLNSLVTFEFSVLLLTNQQSCHQKLLIFYAFYLDCIHHYFCKHLSHQLTTQ